MNRLAVLPVLAVALLAAGCGADDSGDAGSSASSASVSSEPSASTSAAPVVQPCDGLDAAAASKSLGQELTIETGSADSPRCALLPADDGGPAFSVNYQWFPDGLDAAFDTMDIPAGQVSRPQVDGADASRLIVQRTDAAYTITGFIQNGDLVQVLNGVAPKPYDAAAMRATTDLLLTQLSAAAPS